MYKVLNIEDDYMTRFIKLKNLKTNTIEECFDDSVLVSDENFEFMQVGEMYDCKIELFGDVTEEKTPDSVECWIVNRDIVIGKRKLVEVLVDRDVYYVLRSELKNKLMDNTFFYKFSRKDLIQVDDVIHRDLMRLPYIME